MLATETQGGASAPPIFQQTDDGRLVPLTELVFPSEPEFRQREEVLANLRRNLARGLPFLKPDPTPKGGTLILVAGGPSLADTIEDLRELAANPANRIVAANESHDFLIERGIVPWGATYWEVGSPKKASFLERPHPGVRYFIASQAHPEAFDKLEGRADVTMWHIYQGYPDKADVDLVFEHDPEGFLAGGGCGATLRWVYVGQTLGWRKSALFGMDSSFRGDRTHAYKVRDGVKRDASWRPWDDVWCEGRHFKTNSFLLHQANHFQWQMAKCAEQGLEVTVYGDGLIPHMARVMGIHADNRRAASRDAAFPQKERTDGNPLPSARVG